MGAREEMAFYSSFQRPTIGVTCIFYNKVSWLKITRQHSKSSLLENVILVLKLKKIREGKEESQNLHSVEPRQ